MIECGWRGGRGLGWGRAPPRAAHPGPSLGSPTSATVQLQVDCLLLTGRNLTLITPCHNKLVQHFNVQNNCNHKIPLNYLQLPAACHACCGRILLSLYVNMWTVCSDRGVPAQAQAQAADKCWRQLQCVAAARHRAPGSLASHCPGSCRACAHPALYITWAGGATGHPPEPCTLCVAPWPSSWSLLLLMEHAHACNPALAWSRLLLKTVMVSNDIMNWIHSNMQQFWNQHTASIILPFLWAVFSLPLIKITFWKMQSRVSYFLNCFYIITLSSHVLVRKG